jgi:hypothetical protein
MGKFAGQDSARAVILLLCSQLHVFLFPQYGPTSSQWPFSYLQFALGRNAAHVNSFLFDESPVVIFKMPISLAVIVRSSDSADWARTVQLDG